MSVPAVSTPGLNVHAVKLTPINQAGSMTLTEQGITAKRTEALVDRILITLTDGSIVNFRLSCTVGATKKYLKFNPQMIVSSGPQSLEQAATILANKVFENRAFADPQKTRVNIPLTDTSTGYTVETDGNKSSINITNGDVAHAALNNISSSTEAIGKENNVIFSSKTISSSQMIAPSNPAPQNMLSAPISTVNTPDLQAARAVPLSGIYNRGENNCFINSVMQLIANSDLDRAQLNTLQASHELYFLKKIISDLDNGITPESTPARNWLVSKSQRGTDGTAAAIEQANQGEAAEALTIFKDHLYPTATTSLTITDNIKINIGTPFEIIEPRTQSLPTRIPSGSPISINFLTSSNIGSSPSQSLEYLVENHFQQQEGQFGQHYESFTNHGAVEVQTGKTLEINAAPEELSFDVSRVSIDNNSVKNSTPIQITNDQIRIRGQFFADKNDNQEVIYDLTGFTRHMGHATGGHWVSYAKIQNNWYCFNDSAKPTKVSPTALSAAIAEGSLFTFKQNSTQTVSQRTGNVRDEMLASNSPSAGSSSFLKSFKNFLS